ncbi:branched-chain amino acid ABC transporter permease [Natronocalculus amylovorans]|uniref:Branched-chain amino acid ABC transporter permease n=1 Tax=Natronocalculus amylovorans TaxID=2917812 RepID=A0AAE3K9D4_9EURY|nr:branched-chain amino acid ABC transporter permease [Natronocalculus amylovorans]MCL9818247.1 branched-chain amino acid ABC transporter permease [Natronocalculus amylovorans]
MSSETGSSLSTVWHRYKQFRNESYATPLLLGIIFGILIVLPALLEVSIAGYSLGTRVSLGMLIVTLVWAYTAQSWNIMSGFTGQFSFGHAAFFGLGAYGTILLVSNYSINPWIGMLVGAVLAALYGLLIGVLCFRYDLRGHYFALATLAFAELLRFIINNIGALGGASGFIKPLPREYADGPGLLAFQFSTDLPYYYVILAFLLIVTTVAFVIRNSRFGLYLFAIREDENAAAAVGIPTFKYKLSAVAISAFFTAWAGAFWAMYFDTIRPDTVFDLLINVEILLPAIVGGLGTVIGPILGSFIVTPLSEIARQSLDLPGTDRIVYGLLLVLIVLYSPKGVVSWPKRLADLLGWQDSPTDEDAVDETHN